MKILFRCLVLFLMLLNILLFVFVFGVLGGVAMVALTVSLMVMLFKREKRAFKRAFKKFKEISIIPQMTQSEMLSRIDDLWTGVTVGYWQRWLSVDRLKCLIHLILKSQMATLARDWMTGPLLIRHLDKMYSLVESCLEAATKYEMIVPEEFQAFSQAVHKEYERQRARQYVSQIIEEMGQLERDRASLGRELEAARMLVLRLEQAS